MFRSTRLHASPLLRLFALSLTLCGLSTPPLTAKEPWRDLDHPAHRYWTRPLADRFTRLKDDLEAGRVPLDRSSEKAFVESLLKALDVPVGSQLLVYSNTSLQLNLISPRNPRALYFSDDLYVGWVPRGKIEIISLDPELGGVFYIFDIPRSETAPLKIERSNQCMNCHSAADTGYVPGLAISSVIPARGGGSLVSYRQERTGHDIPFHERFGGWHVTGEHHIGRHLGNVIGDYENGQMVTLPLGWGERFDPSRYPAQTSDILPHLLHEHQAGFVNRVTQAAYRTRAALYLAEIAAGGAPASSAPALSPEQNAELDAQALLVTRYLLFADEAPLPAGGVKGDPAFKEDFAKRRKATADGLSLRDFDLHTRLFKHRCSYMIYSPVFTGLPREMKSRVYALLDRALDPDGGDPAWAWLPRAEKETIRRILLETLPDFAERNTAEN